MKRNGDDDYDSQSTRNENNSVFESISNTEMCREKIR